MVRVPAHDSMSDAGCLVSDLPVINQARSSNTGLSNRKVVASAVCSSSSSSPSSRSEFLRQQCLTWNKDKSHQSLAGKARAKSFTREYQRACGFASFSAFSARWRAAGGLAPLSSSAVARYVAPDMIRAVCGGVVPAPLQQMVYDSWCAGDLRHVHVLIEAAASGAVRMPANSLWAGMLIGGYVDAE